MNVTMTLQVTGMTCGHCVKAVTEEIAALTGVSSVTIDLVPAGTSSVTVSADGPLDQRAVAAALERAGDYRLCQ
jgi:copper chaperone